MTKLMIYYIDRDGNHSLVDDDGFKVGRLKIDGSTFEVTSLNQRLYTSYQDGAIYVSESLEKILLHKYGKVELLEGAKVFYQRFGFIYPPFTIYKDIYLMVPCIRFYVCEDRLMFESSRYQTIHDESVDFTQENLEDSLVELLESYIDRSIDKVDSNTLSVLFSGGIDSAVLLGLFRDNKDFHAAFTCNMPTLKTEITKSVKMCEAFSLPHHIINIPSDLNESAREFVDKYYEPIQDNIAPVFIYLLKEIDAILSSNANNDKEVNHYLLDGQGADSLLSGLPHDKVYRAYKIVKRVPGLRFILKLFPKDYPREKSRFLYRLFKAASVLSFDNEVELFADSLVEKRNINIDFDNVVFEHFILDVSSVNKIYDNFHLVIRHIFMFRILPARELQKYFGKPKNVNLLLPFLDDLIISKLFYLDPDLLIDKGIFKKPMVNLAKRFWPRFFNSSNTSPFEVIYDVGGVGRVNFSLDTLVYNASKLKNNITSSHN